MSETMRLVAAGIAWVAFWYGIPMAVAYWKLNLKDGVSIITGEPLAHPHAASHS